MEFKAKLKSLRTQRGVTQQQLADIVLTSLPVILVYLLGQKYIVSGMTAGAVKG